MGTARLCIHLAGKLQLFLANRNFMGTQLLVQKVYRAD